MEEGFELVVESGDFRSGYAGRKRQDQSIGLDLGRRKSGVSRSMQVRGPEAIISVGAGRESQQPSGEAQNVSHEPWEEFAA
jgi:hypothetical protein